MKVMPFGKFNQKNQIHNKKEQKVPAQIFSRSDRVLDRVFQSNEFCHAQSLPFTLLKTRERYMKKLHQYFMLLYVYLIDEKPHGCKIKGNENIHSNTG